MKWLLVAFLIVGCDNEPASTTAQPAAKPAGSGAVSATDSGSAAAPTTQAEGDYRADIEALCDVIARSNSSDLQGANRRYQVAVWLGANLHTDEARAFLAKIQPLQGAAKADALDDEARKVGLSNCTLAGEWRAPHL